MIQPVVSGELLAHQLLFQPVGNPPAVELILQFPVAFVVHDALSHGRTSSALICREHSTARSAGITAAVDQSGARNR